MDASTQYLREDNGATAEISLTHNKNAAVPQISENADGPGPGCTGTREDVVDYVRGHNISALNMPLTLRSESTTVLSPPDVTVRPAGSFDKLRTLLPSRLRLLKPASTESLSHPEPGSVDDFLNELDQNTERSLDPPPPDGRFSPTTPSLLNRVSRRFSRRKVPSSSNASAVAPSVAQSIRLSAYKSTATLVSAGAFCFEHLDSRPYRTYSVRTFCESLFNSPRAVQAKIESVKRYGDRNGVLHRFLIFHVTRIDGREFYLRMDRRKDPAVPLWVFGMQGMSTRLANDTVAISGRLEHLYDYAKGEPEATIVFPTPAPLLAVAQVLYSVATVSQGYNLTKENCWFFTSIIQEILVKYFGAQFTSDTTLNHPTLADERRKQILAYAYHEAKRGIDRGLDAVLKLTTLIGDSTLANSIESFSNALKKAHELVYHNTPDFARQFDLQTRRLLVALHRKLHEHLHACCGFQGAGMFSSSAELLLHLASFKRRLPTVRRCSIPSEEDIVKIINAVSNTAMSVNAAPRCSSYTYGSDQPEPPSPSTFPLHAQQLVLSALELLTDCSSLASLPTTWRLQTNRDIPGLQSEFRNLMSDQLSFVCRHWIDLLREMDGPDDEVMTALSRCVPIFRHWVASMGVMGELEQACRGLKALHVWLDVRTQVDDTRQTVYDLYRWIMHSKNALAMASLSIIGNGHPFIPSNSLLRRTSGTGISRQSQIVAKHMNTKQGWLSRVLNIKMDTFVKAAVFSPDGCLLATSSLYHAVHVWDAATGAHLRGLNGHTGVVESIAFSPDGRHLASASRDCTVHVWDAATGASLRVLKGHSNTINSVAFSPDSRRLASASSDCTVRIWDAATGTSLPELKGHTGAVQGVAISPGGCYLASASDDHTVRLWNVATGVFIRKFQKHTGKVYSVAFSPDGRRLASASADCTIRVWDLAAGVTLRELTHHRPVVSATFSPDGRHLASASNDYAVYMWDVVTGGSRTEFKGHADRVVSVAFSPDSRHLASASWDHTVRVWDVMTHAPLQNSNGHTATVNCITFSPDGNHLASLSDDYTIQVWDVIDRCPISARKLEGQSCPLDVSFSPDGSMLMLHYSHGDLHLDSRNLEIIACPPPLPSAPFRSAPSPSLYIDLNSVCCKGQNTMLRICWLPDYFKPTTPVVQHENHTCICIGGREGMIAFINLDGTMIPDI